MKVKIGNIPPNSQIEITYSYLQELETSLNKFWKFIIPSTLTPRYSSNNQPITENLLDLENIQTISGQSPQAYTWSIAIKIQQTTEIVALHSPSHQLLILSKNVNSTEIEAMVENSVGKLLPNKDFVLIFRNEQIRQPQVILGADKNNEQLCAMISFVPDFSNCQLDDALKQSLNQSQNDDPDDFPINYDAARSEYIFLIDRSGSMGGQRIENAKEALILFLKSMPTNTYFNIYSFGSQFSSMFPKSVPYQTDKVQQAIQEVTTFSANFGGTEIYQPLVKILKQTPRIKGFPRQIFLLTDGDVSNTNQVIQLIRENNQFNRVHSIGIGSGASNYLIKQSAKEGKGNSVFVTNNKDISSSIIKLLKYSLTPCLDNFVFTYDQSIIVTFFPVFIQNLFQKESIIPAPNNIPCILKNQPFIIYMFFKPGILSGIQTQVVLTCSDSALNENLTFIVEINSLNCLITENAYKLGIYKMLKCLEQKLISSNQELEDDILLSKKINIKEEIVELSTAFLCVVNEIADENANQVLNKSLQQKIIVPSLTSNDYEKKNEENQNIFFSYQQQQCHQQQRFHGGLFGSGGTFGAQRSKPMSQTVQFQSIPKPPQLPQFDLFSIDSCQIQSKSISKPPPIPSLSVHQQQCELNQQFDLLDINLNQISNQQIPQPPQKQEIFEKQQYQKPIAFQHTFSFGEQEQQQYQQQMQPQKQKPIIINKGELFKLIVNSFQLEGYWRHDQQLISSILKNYSEFSFSIPQLDINANLQDYWTTIIVLAWLEAKYSDNKNEWILIAQKTENWLNKFGQWIQFLPNAQSLLK